MYLATANSPSRLMSTVASNAADAVPSLRDISHAPGTHITGGTVAKVNRTKRY